MEGSLKRRVFSGRNITKSILLYPEPREANVVQRGKRMLSRLIQTRKKRERRKTKKARKLRKGMIKTTNLQMMMMMNEVVVGQQYFFLSCLLSI